MHLIAFRICYAQSWTGFPKYQYMSCHLPFPVSYFLYHCLLQELLRYAFLFSTPTPIFLDLEVQIWFLNNNNLLVIGVSSPVHNLILVSKRKHRWIRALYCYCCWTVYNVIDGSNQKLGLLDSIVGKLLSEKIARSLSFWVKANVWNDCRCPLELSGIYFKWF